MRGYSLGMRQRLGLAAALLGDPRVLVLDEPANGLDPDGIRWLRGFCRHLAGEGRTVLVSSHQLNEVQEIADRVVILNHGQLVRLGVDRRADRRHRHACWCARPTPTPLGAALAAAGAASPAARRRTRCRCAACRCEQVGHLAFTAGVELHELSPRRLRPRGAVLRPHPARRPTGSRPGAPATGPTRVGSAR